MSHGPIHERMQADHVRISEILDTVEMPDGIDFGAYQRFRGGLLRHIGMEEKILLPAIKKMRDGVDLPAAKQLKLDHAALAALLVPTPTSDIIKRLRKLLAVHDAVEEGPQGLYAECERIAGAQADELCARMETAPVVSLSAYRDGPKTFEAIDRLMHAAGRK